LAAAANGHIGVLEFLKAKGIALDLVAEKHPLGSPLTAAAASGCVELVDRILSHPEFNFASHFTHTTTTITPLFIAIVKKQFQVIFQDFIIVANFIHVLINYS
jgi:hypothetical protein